MAEEQKKESIKDQLGNPRVVFTMGGPTA